MSTANTHQSLMPGASAPYASVGAAAVSLPAGPLAVGQNIQMAKELYEIMIAKMYKQEAKLKASSDLHLMVMRKDDAIKSLQEKNSLLERSSSASETRLAKLIRMHEEQSQQFKSISGFASRAREVPVGIAHAQRHHGTSGGEPLTTHDLETDETPEEQDRLLERVKGPPDSISSTRSGRTRRLSVPGISKELFDRVVSDNIKLKTLLEERLNDSGQTIEGQLDVKEYEDIIHQLRVELQAAKDQIKNLTLVLENAGDGSNLKEQYAELLQRAGKLEKNLFTKQALLMSYMSEYEKIRRNNADLVSELNLIKGSYGAQAMVHADGGEVVTEPQRSASETETQTQGNSAATPDDEAPDFKSGGSYSIATLHEEIAHLKELLDKQSEQSKEEILGLQEDNQRLNQVITETNRAIEMERRKINDLENKIALLREENQGMEGERQIQQLQLKTFEEDYALEKQDKLKTKKDLEKSLSQCQLSISKLTDERNNMVDRYTDMKNRYDDVKGRYDALYVTYARVGGGGPVQSCFPGQLSRSPQPTLIPAVPAASCAEMVKKSHAPWKEQHYRPDSLMMDAPPSLSSSQSGSESPSLPSGASLPTSDNGMFICERCEREFDHADREKYMDHISKCTDD